MNCYNFLQTVFSEYFWLTDGIFVATLSVLITGILIPRILLISYRKNLFDIPDERKIHHGTVPRLGGMAFMPSIVLSIALVCGFSLLFCNGYIPGTEYFMYSTAPVEVCFGLSALMMLYLVGLADDLIGVKYRAKFVAQAIAALLIVCSGLTVHDLEGFLGIWALPTWVADVLTVMVVLLIVNAINLIDGIDGLASGLTGIALAFYAFISYRLGEHIFFLISIATLGTLIPFFYYNVYGNQKLGKKIFMGDTGAMTSGLILSFIAIKLSNALESEALFGDCKPLVMAFSPLLVPALDVLRVFIHRIRLGRNPFEPGRTHIHHKFLAIGVRQRYVMLIILAISAALTLLNVLLSPAVPIFAILVSDILLWALLNIVLTKAIQRRQKKHPEVASLYD